MVDDETHILPKRLVPDDAIYRIKYWKFIYSNAHRAYYILGILSVGCSVIATFIDAQSTARIFSGMAAVSVAIIGATKPDRIYFRFVRAWRILDIASIKYKNGLISIEDLISKIAESESVLGGFEEIDSQPTRPADNESRDE